jgi:hypothetical protein
MVSGYQVACIKDFLSQYRRLIAMSELGAVTLSDRRLALEIETLCGFGRASCGHLSRLLKEGAAPAEVGSAAPLGDNHVDRLPTPAA